MVPHPGLEAHLHPFKISAAKDDRDTEYYLHTSPEFFMKEMLVLGFEKIFTLTHCFRDEPTSSTHNPQFLMLEWYRSQERYEKIMEDTEKLISFCYGSFKKEAPAFTRKTVDQIFEEFLGFKITNFLNKDQFIEKIQSFDPSLVTDKSLDWEDYFFLVFLNHIEPQFEKYPALILYEYPAPLAALSTLKNEQVCERFEIYLKGIEVGNCFNELTNLSELKKRFTIENNRKKELYSYSLPTPNRFFEVQNNLPNSAGIALGVDRLFMAIFNLENIFTPENYFN